MHGVLVEYKLTYKIPTLEVIVALKFILFRLETIILLEGRELEIVTVALIFSTKKTARIRIAKTRIILLPISFNNKRELVYKYFQGRDAIALCLSHFI